MNRERFWELLERYGWHQQGKEKAAEELGISLRTLYRRIKKHNITGARTQ